MKTHDQRLTATVNGELVVFLIGMRINRWWKVHRWMRVGAAMPRMLFELQAKPELGFLGYEVWPGRTILVLQYWRSMDTLLSYAKSRDAAHLPAWRSFNKLVGTNGDVGIWHETYRVRPGDYENIYVNMPPFGLGKVGQLAPATGKREHAEARLRADTPKGL